MILLCLNLEKFNFHILKNLVKEKEFKSRPNNRRTERSRRSSQDQNSNNSTKAVNNDRGDNTVGPGGVMIKSAKVTKAPMMTGGNQHKVLQCVDDGQLGSGQLQGKYFSFFSSFFCRCYFWPQLQQIRRTSNAIVVHIEEYD